MYEADEIEGLCYLALAYCDGPTLDQWIEERTGPLDPVFATQLMLPLVEAVEHAHTRGILHRDIKPANMLLPAADTSEPLPFNPKLTDFGLAKVIEEKGGQTLAGMVLGTVHYMAPEQAAGHTGANRPGHRRVFARRRFVSIDNRPVADRGQFHDRYSTAAVDRRAARGRANRQKYPERPHRNRPQVLAEIAQPALCNGSGAGRRSQSLFDRPSNQSPPARTMSGFRGGFSATGRWPRC